MAKLTVLIGAPGAGKSHYAEKLAKQLATVITNDGKHGTSSGDILHNAYRQIHQRLAQGKDVVFDTTGINPAIRKAAVTIARKYNAQVDAHVVDAPLQTCLDAQKGRARPVPAADVRRMYAAVPRTAAQLKAEGFQNVQTRRRK